MKIAAANLQMTASHQAETRHAVSQRLHMWAGGENSRPSEGRGRHPAATEAHLSDAGKAAQAAETTPADAARAAVENDPRMRLIRSLIELLTGQPVKVFDGRDLDPGPNGGADVPTAAPSSAANPEPAGNPAPPAGYGVEYDYHESYSETEQTSFQASGTVKTADGREIQFQLSFDLQRSYQVESEAHLRLGDAARQKDPLVINFSGTAAQLTDTRFSFDLNADDQPESIASLGAGSGFLALDRNGDGKINNGSELFGPTSGDGFSELASLDSDGNGWIDENDTAYDRLQVWNPGTSGTDQPKSLAQAGVGAISLARLATPFQLNTSENASLGQIRSSGIFLRESGEAGTIQQIDLTV